MRTLGHRLVDWTCDRALDVRDWVRGTVADYRGGLATVPSWDTLRDAT